MRKSKLMSGMLLAGILTLLIGPVAQAAVAPLINPVPPATTLPSGEPPLLGSLNAITSGANYAYVGSTINNQIAEKLFKACTPTAPVTITILEQHAGHAAYHRLGYYLQPGAVDPIGPTPTFAIPGVTFVAGDLDLNTSTAITPSGSFSPAGVFGLFMDDRANGAPPNGYYPSEEVFDPSGSDVHMAVFTEKNANGEIVPCSFIVAVEDLHALGDRDYNDNIFRITNVEPVPEPATLSLLGLGALALIRRRKRQ